MTTTEIMKRELNDDLEMVRNWKARLENAVTKDDKEYYRGCILRSRYRAEAKAELIQTLGYTVLYDDDREECIAVYSMELDD